MASEQLTFMGFSYQNGLSHFVKGHLTIAVCRNCIILFEHTNLPATVRDSGRRRADVRSGKRVRYIEPRGVAQQPA